MDPNRRAALLVLLIGLGAAAADPPELEQARKEAERVRRLVEEGALPRRALAEAELALAEAQDQATLKRTLFGKVPLEELTEEQAEEMVAAARRLVERQQQELSKARKLVRENVLSRTALGPFEEELRRREETLELANRRAGLFRELVEIVRLEEALQKALEEDPMRAGEIAERFDGSGVLLTSQLDLIRLEYERAFGASLPVTANGATALHRALGFDHRGRVDVALHPDSREGAWRRLLEELRIPYFAFRAAAPGRSTGAHIHIGPPSPRLTPAN